jgi:predicted metal-dependent RNase
MVVAVILLIVLLHDVREQGAEENIWAKEGAHNRIMEKITLRFVLATNIIQMIRSRIGNAGHVARMGNKKCVRV